MTEVPIRNLSYLPNYVMPNYVLLWNANVIIGVLCQKCSLFITVGIVTLHHVCSVLWGGDIMCSVEGYLKCTVWSSVQWKNIITDAEDRGTFSALEEYHD